MSSDADVSPVLAIHRWRDNGALIADCARLGYLRNEWPTLDPTYGYGTFWARWRPRLLVRSDRDPTKSLDVPGGQDATDLPYPDRSFAVVVIDPPYKLNGTPAPSVDERYGVDVATGWRDRMALIRAMVAEAARVSDRMLVVKCQDQVVSGRIRWQTRVVEDVATGAGFGLRDRLEFISHRPQPAGRTQRNAHRCSSQLLVLQRGWTWSDR